MRRIYHNLKNRVIILLQRNKLIWSILTLNKLRFKFKALYFGININKKTLANLYNFRRNIHRLEKGLSYENLKPIFAEDFIYETVLYLEHGKRNNTFDKHTIDWGKAVLELYFSKVKITPVIENAYNVYKTIRQSETITTLVPYLEKDRQTSDITYDQLYQLSLKRRSIRFFLDKSIEATTIKQAYEIAKYSPSACNRQSFEYLFYNDEKIVNKLASIPGGVQGYSLPSLIVVIGNYSGYFDERDINAPIIDSSLSAMAFLFALETLGLSSVCINWPNLPDREKAIREIIDLNQGEFVIMMIGVGYAKPTGKIPYSSKRSAEEVIHVNKRIK